MELEYGELIQGVATCRYNGKIFSRGDNIRVHAGVHLGKSGVIFDIGEVAERDGFTGIKIKQAGGTLFKTSKRNITKV